MENQHIKGIGAQKYTHNRFAGLRYETEDELFENSSLKLIDVEPKTLVNKVESPDTHMKYSLNPYQGCEHGCTYCYARMTHEYWGYNPGSDFERVILVKRNAPRLLTDFLTKKNWDASPIFMSGNTDCYQPVERKLGITRRLLQIFHDTHHPCGIITKNQLITRDKDLLKRMAEKQLVQVWISLNTLTEETRRSMEPRTASVKARLNTIESLSRAGIPVGVIIAPVVPGLTSHEIPQIIKEVAKRGAKEVTYIVVRLNGAAEDVFSDWVKKAFPYRAEKILNQIRETHDGKMNETDFSKRMRGEGHIADEIAQLFYVARKKWMGKSSFPPLRKDLFVAPGGRQLSMF